MPSWELQYHLPTGIWLPRRQFSVGGGEAQTSVRPLYLSIIGFSVTCSISSALSSLAKIWDSISLQIFDVILSITSSSAEKSDTWIGSSFESMDRMFLFKSSPTPTANIWSKISLAESRASKFSSSEGDPSVIVIKTFWESRLKVAPTLSTT